MVVLAAPAGCRSQQDVRLAAECEAGTCITIDESADPTAPLAVQPSGRGTNGGFLFGCLLVQRRSPSGSTIGFESRQDPLFQDYVFPLDGAVGKVLRCDQESSNPFAARRTRLLVLVNPAEYASLAPARGNVVIPFTDRDDLKLDGGLTAYARTVVDARGSTSKDTVDLVVSAPGAGDTFYEGLREASTFTWGSQRAEIVRIVLPTALVSGWVEVAVH